MAIIPNDPITAICNNIDASCEVFNKPHDETHENVKSLDWALENPNAILPVEVHPTDPSKLVFTSDVYYINSLRVRVKLIAQGTETPSFQTTGGVGQYRYDVLQASDTSVLTIIMGGENLSDSLVANHPDLPQDQFVVFLVRVHNSVAVELVVSEDVFGVQGILHKKALAGGGSGGGSIASLNDVGDVLAPSPADGQFLQWSDSSSAWIPASTGGLAPHTHTIADVTNLTTVLANKADTTHGHAVGDLSDSEIISIQNNQIYSYESGSWRNKSTLELSSSSDVACLTATTQRALRAVAPNEVAFFDATGGVAVRARSAHHAGIFESTGGTVAICATSTDHTTILARSATHTAIHACAVTNQAGVFEAQSDVLKVTASYATAGIFQSASGVAVRINSTCGSGLSIQSCFGGIQVNSSKCTGIHVDSGIGQSAYLRSASVAQPAVCIINTATASAATGLIVVSTGGTGIYSSTQATVDRGNWFHAPNTIRGLEVVGGSCGTTSRANDYDFYANGFGANYGPFTGAHDVILENGEYLPGMLLEITNKVYHDTRGLSNIIPKVKPADSNNSRGIYGFFVKEIILGKDHWVSKQIKKKKGGIVNALGEGLALVTSINGKVEKGDLLTSTTVKGYAGVQLTDSGEKKDYTIQAHTAARALENVDWKKVKKKKNEKNKSKLIAVVYLSA